MNAMQSSNVRRISTLLCAVVVPATVLASEARTTANASNGPYGPGTATATATYQGDRGYARTQTRTGEVNHARAVAVGIDEDGLSVSISHAYAPRNGPAFGTNFNYTFSRDGEIARSSGQVTARGGVERSVAVGGQTSSGRSGAVATSLASGRTTHGGVVRANVRSDHERGHGRRYLRLP